jgi:hypothetical protein
LPQTLFMHAGAASSGTQHFTSPTSEDIPCLLLSVCCLLRLVVFQR